jgi:hypothetical protein
LEPAVEQEDDGAHGQASATAEQDVVFEEALGVGSQLAWIFRWRRVSWGRKKTLLGKRGTVARAGSRVSGMMGGVMWSWGAKAWSPSRPHCCRSIRVTVSYSPDIPHLPNWKTTEIAKMRCISR